MRKERRGLVWMAIFALSTLFFGGAAGQVRYSVPEEMAPGSFVGDIAKDLGLDAKRLITGKAQIFSKSGRAYVDLDRERGHIVIKERIDRESLCASTMSACSFSFEVILENPIELYRVTVEILDVNDNSPAFPKNEIEIEISESVTPGTRFTLESAVDPDVGINSIQSYSVHPTDHFTLKKQNRPGISKNVELVLQTPLDRERQQHMYLTLTAVDGGNPKRSGTVKIHIIILDANDNAPVFAQDSYKISVPENAAKGTLLITVNATDADTESYARIQYYFEHAGASINELFSINASTGEIRLIGRLDFEKSPIHEFRVQAKDRGGLSDSAEVIAEVTDVNDNAPTMALMSYSNSLPENAPPGTVVAMINVQDGDSEENGRVICTIDSSLPFKIKSSMTDYYSLVTDSDLDREHISEYNITVTAKDGGSPPLSSSKTLSVKISDINDHSPVFEHDTYNAFIMENNSPSLSVLSLRASDADLGPNARISYFIGETDFKGAPVSSLVSINSESGVIYATKSFDYEQVKSFSINVKAQDGGSPPLSTNVTVNVFIQDQNDNAPQILYPVQTGGSLVAEIVPRSADVGYLVTKVVAVDVDSGQNAWLSYKLLKTTDRALFEIGTQNGEIRTIRQVTDKDAVKQKLTVVVEDNGQPSRSATVNVNVVLADSFPEVLSEFSDFTHDKEYNDNLTFYLVLALAVVSFLFIVSIIAILSVKCYRWRRERMLYKSSGNLPVIPYYPPLYADVDGTGTLKQMYNYELCGTTDSRKSELTYVRPCGQSVLSVDLSGTRTVPRQSKAVEDSIDSLEQKPPNQDWRFNQNQRPGPSGAAATPEVAVGTGPWPNPPTEAEQLQALMAAANGASHTSSPPLYSSPRSCLLISEVSEATNTLTPGTMGLSTRYSPQFTLQHVPDYRQNVYIPGSTATLTSNPQQQQQQQLQLQQQMLPNMPPQQALPPAQATGPDGAAGGGAPGAQSEPPKAAQTPASKKKSTKKEKK
ncbi:protocadherin 2 gamma 28 isoform X17 [Alosa sapidissima]|uniref:protocadherin 2 gamma 28 isoform X17 n=1 Tax=Alosa sapidissima TaxID=34773 RepID=UPI001C09097D|nr:protocadherin 2 gamma 28 isoform X17 [Alosa sapidissima]